ncbi:MAG: DNA repair protein RecN [Chloroflexi bacterium]|nr:DNA repair protein RecN [Chloroflexota bacterium]
MLLQLTIDNFAIIDHLDLTLGAGLNILTGETGAGKSIIIDAVGALLGGRVGPEAIRAGARQAHVEGIFVPPEGSEVAHLLAEHELAAEEDTVILSRDVNATGRSIARVNGRAVPQSVLQQIGHTLVDVHGQSEHLSVLRESTHIDFLDGYAGLLPKREAFAAAAAEFRSVRREIDSLLRDERELARRMDLLRYQVDEIRAAGLRPDEEDELRQERNLLVNAERLAAGADAAYHALHGSEGASVLDLLGEVGAQIDEIVRIDPSLESSRRTIVTATDELLDVARTLRAYRENVEFDPERLAAVDERLELIRNRKRKYGSSIAEVIAFGESAARELEEIGHREERVDDLRRREAELRGRAVEMADELSAARTAAATELARAVEAELADLNMPRARFAAEIRRSPIQEPRVQESHAQELHAQDLRAAGLPLADGQTYAFEVTGVDRVQFLIAANPGEPLKSLARIASGGETSRLLLALKTILARGDRTPVQIFDEIDVGIGGRSGRIVGQKLALLARERQVICVTHLPQIACFGDAHFHILKQTDGERTTARVQSLDDARRIEELAVMLGGQGSERARENARELVETALLWKRAALPQGATG